MGFCLASGYYCEGTSPLPTLKCISHHESTPKASTLELKGLFWIIRSFSEVPLSAWALAGLFCAVLSSLLYTNPLSTDPTEKVTLQVVPQGPFKEGDNVTLKCTADGNPPPSSYIFYMKVNLLRLTQGVYFVVVSQEMKAAFC